MLVGLSQAVAMARLLQDRLEAANAVRFELLMLILLLMGILLIVNMMSFVSIGVFVEEMAVANTVLAFSDDSLGLASIAAAG